MPRKSSPAIINIRLNATTRWLTLLPAVLAILCGWFAVRWYLGNTISEAATTNETPNIEVARMAARWAPSDPFVHWRLGVMAQKEFSANNLEETVREFEAAVRLAPNDFRYWDELGRALEAAGDAEAGERALRHSVELAPAYYYPAWHYGNLLLREGKFETAFPQLFHAAEANGELWPQVFNLAWQAYDGDVDRIAKEACRAPAVRTMFAVYLVGLKRFDDALRLWHSLSAAYRTQLNAGGYALRKSLFEAKQFHAALDVTRDIESGGASPNPEEISNGGFEGNMTLPASKAFGWTIGPTSQAQVAINNLAHSGQHSLRVIFSAPNKLDHVNISQTVVVQPNTQYHFECYARTEKLVSASTPVIMIFDAADGTLLNSSAPLPTGTHDWQKIALDFKTKNGDGLTVTIGRLTCSVGDICPLFGTVWYDDFDLQRSGAGNARRDPSPATSDTNRGANR